ncbi:MAG: hypothetical protein E3J43_05030 [Candidatus Heimdallarchaeota archaeon]|nr:MAG: hypothetical protein E3J43_05030 [Candidatus Heimdallarchaeota archaeon]
MTRREGVFLDSSPSSGSYFGSYIQLISGKADTEEDWYLPVLSDEGNLNRDPSRREETSYWLRNIQAEFLTNSQGLFISIDIRDSPNRNILFPAVKGTNFFNAIFPKVTKQEIPNITDGSIRIHYPYLTENEIESIKI